jgi:hypothetical protein
MKEDFVKNKNLKKISKMDILFYIKTSVAYCFLLLLPEWNSVLMVLNLSNESYKSAIYVRAILISV